MKILAIVAPCLLLAAACSSTSNSGGTGGSGQGGKPAGQGGAPGLGGMTTTTSMGGAPGLGGAVGAGGATQTGSGGSTGGGTDSGVDTRVDATAPKDAVATVDGAVGTNGAYVRTGWTGAYTCTGTCLAGNGDSPQDMPSLAFDNNFQTRWSTNRFQTDFVTANPTKFPLFFTVDMKQVVNVSKITMHPSCRDIFDAPGQLDVLLSVDGTTFTAIVMNHKPAVPPNGEACPPTANAVATDTITFATTAARFVQIRATQSVQQAHPGSGDRYWAIGEFNAFP